MPTVDGNDGGPRPPEGDWLGTPYLTFPELSAPGFTSRRSFVNPEAHMARRGDAPYDVAQQ
jgi:hypothetical protein